MHRTNPMRPCGEENFPMMQRTIFLLSSLCAFALVMSACGAAQHPMPEPGIQRAEVLIEHVQQREQLLHSARAEAVMEYFGNDGRVRVRQALLARRPGNFRLETLSPMDSTLAVVVTNDTELTYYDLADEKAYTGAPTAQNLARLIPLWLSPAQIVHVVLGSVPFDVVDAAPDAWSVAWDGKKNAWRLDADTLDGGTMQFWVRNESWVLAGARARDSSDNVLWEIRTADFERVSDGENDTELPKRIRFLMNDEDLDVSLTVKRYEINPDLGEYLFELFVPDVEQIPLDAPQF